MENALAGLRVEVAAGCGRGVEGRAVSDAAGREGVIEGVIECIWYRPGIPGGVRYLRVFFVRCVSQRGFRYGGGRRTALCDNLLQDHIWEGGGGGGGVWVEGCM